MAKEIIKLNEISKVYGELLASRLADGYTIYLKTMGGTQGEYGRLDLTKDGGKTVHRLYMNRKSENGNAIYNGTKVWFNVDVIQIIEEEFDLEIPDADAEKVVTVGDVVDYIKDNV